MAAAATGLSGVRDRRCLAGDDFLGCGFAAKYPEGGGNFSVPLQWMLGLRRLGLDAVWLELLPGDEQPA